MAIKIAEGFDYNGSSPNFARDQFATLAAMKSFPTTSIDEGHISYCVEDGKTYQYKSSNESDDTTGQWAEFSGSGGSGSGSGFYNVTLLHPLGSGFYTLTTAIAALEDATIDDTEKWAMIITFETSAGTWEDYRFSGTSLDSFTTVAAWAEYGGAGAIKKITISSGTEVTPYTPDGDGAVVIPIPETAVDESMDSNSTNPVQNKAVVAAMANLTSECIVKFETETDSDEVTTLYGYNAEEEVVSSVTLPAGGGTTATTKIQLTRLSASQTVKSGDDVKLTYWFDHIDSETSESTGNSGEATITITYGATTSTLTQTLTAGTNNTIDVTGYMGVGTNTVKVKVTVTDGETVQTSTVSWTITVIQLTLTSTYNWVSSISKGDTITVPYALTGSGTKTLKCYVDGVEYDDKSITTSTSNGSFSVSTSSLAHGSHSIQMVCELELSTDSIIKSNSIYFDVAVRESGNTTPIIATRFDYSDGTIIGANATPYLPVTQYDLYELNYAAYNPKETPTSVIIIEGDTTVSTASVTFTQTTLSLRAMSSGEAECSITCGATVYNYTLNVSQSELNLSEPTDGLVLKLDAQGRSNSDTNKEEWSYGDVTTSFEGFKWGGDGWVDNALRLSANARATVNYQPLGQTTQNTSNSFAFMVKYMVTDVTDDEATVISCLDSDGTGFEITTNEARMMTKGNSSLSMMMEAGSVYEVGFVSYPISSTNSSDHEKLNTEMVYLYINGIMSGCVQRGSGDNIYQTNPQYISMGSSSATTDVYMVRCYNSYLSDDQMLNCYILDQDSSDEMFDLYNANDIVDGNGDVTVDSIPDDMRYVIVTGAQSNGVSTI
ncbi:MAG: head-tail adaptor protein, partial [Rikenellaceae bacterium]